MLETICTRLANYTDADPETKEIISYGLETLLSTLNNIILLTILSALLHCLPQMAVYVLSFAGLRSSAGGYHAKNHILCLLEYAVTSVLGIFVSSLLIDYAAIYIPVAYLVTAALIFLFAPKTHVNRPICKAEYQIFRKRSRITVLAYLPVLAALYFLNVELATVAVTAILTLAITIIKLNKGENYYENESESYECN